MNINIQADQTIYAHAMNQNIHIHVKTSYIDEQSNPKQSRFVFGYTITVQNNGPVAAQLISRHWLVSDANGAVQEVKGLGVIGKQPIIKPGDSFTYSSGTILPTDTGSMKGSYQMVTNGGEAFEVEIPNFVLVPPHKLH